MNFNIANFGTLCANVSSRVGCLSWIARGRGLTVTFARVLVQARVSGPGAPPTNTGAFVPALTVSLLLYASRLQELGFPSASERNRIGHFLSAATSQRFEVYVSQWYRTQSPLRILALPRQALIELLGGS